MENRVVLDGRLLRRGTLRHTPAGIAAIDFTVIHDSTQTEAGRERKVRCEVAAVALGETATIIGAMEPEQSLRVSGFLMQRGSNDRQLTIHATDVATIVDDRINEDQE